MDTISRENNSMLPVGAIIVGVIALVLGGYAAISLSKVNTRLAEHDKKLERVEAVEAAANSASAAADRTGKDLQALTRQTQDGFNQISEAIRNLVTTVTKLEESAKKPVVAAKDGKKGSGEPAVAGANEYIVKGGDTGTKISKATGASVADIEAVNPGLDWRKLKPGQKLKLPAKK
jgi:LysM repeat protein